MQEKLQETAKIQSSQLKEVVSTLSEKKLETKEKPKRKRKLRPLPSVNIMRNRIARYYDFEIRSFLKNIKKKSPHALTEALHKARSDYKTKIEVKKKSVQEVKNLYFRFFGHKHGLKKVEK